jgi:hypothetical protein
MPGRGVRNQLANRATTAGAGGCPTWAGTQLSPRLLFPESTWPLSVDARESLFPAVLTSGHFVWSPVASCRRARRTAKPAEIVTLGRVLGPFSSVSS